ncbi:MAG: NfeD family protein [Actinomycetota bacterium]
MPRPPTFGVFGGALAVAAFMLAGIGGAAPEVAEAVPQAPSIDYTEVTGLLDPPTSSFLIRQIKASGIRDAAALVVRLDSPGSVRVSAAPIVEAIRRAGVPVVVWVAPAASPAASKANSAAAAIVRAAHVAVAAPGSTVGSLSAEQALVAGVVDFVASSLPELLNGLSGTKVEVLGKPTQLARGPFVPQFRKMGMVERLLHGAIRPPAAFLLLLIGIFALIFELYNPGVGGAALSGGLAVGFGLYGLTILPANWIAVAALVLAIGMLTADLHASQLGVKTWAGLGCLVGGSLLVLSGDPAPLALPWWAMGLGFAATLGFFFGVMPAAIRSRSARPLSGAEDIVGTVGVARTDISPEGQVVARGTLWKARTLGAAIAQTTLVEIKGVSGLMLMVEPANLPVPETSGPPVAE